MTNVLSAISNADAELARGVIYHQSGDLDQAEVLYRAVLDAQPDHPEANHNFGVLTWQRERPEAALPYLQAAVRGAPGEQRFWLGYIDALSAAGQTEAARAATEQARQRGLSPVATDASADQLADVSPDEAARLATEFMDTLAVLFDKRLFDEAENVAQQMTTLLPNVGFGWKALAAALYQRRQLTPALAALDKAAVLLPDDADVRADIASIRAEINPVAHLSPAPRPARLVPASAGEKQAGTPWFKHLAGGLAAAVPVLIPTFNNSTYVRRIIPQLHDIGLKNIVLVDNASTAPEMLTFLQSVQNDVIVVRRDHNAGPRDLFMSAENYNRLPEIFCITDPDLEFNSALPDEFLLELIDATEKFKTGKAGMALDIADREAMRDEDFIYGNRPYKIWDWESQFWRHQVGTTPAGDPIYNAPIDTTFAVYNKKYFRPETHLLGVRVAGRYTCRHLPWYKDVAMPASEEEYYRQHQKYSCYLPRRT